MVEYVLLVSAVLLVCIYFFTNQSGGPMPAAVNTALNTMVNMVDNLNSQIQLP